MNLLKDVYCGSLAPRGHYLADEVVLSLAWKKTHSYIRRHSWYADALELDCSAVALESLVARWASDIGKGTYQARPARLVLAPKNARWTFDARLPGGWGPVESLKQITSLSDTDTTTLGLRPLAHLGIREQTAATAVMLCLADCVETAQGNPSLEPALAKSLGVCSYGNRLYSQWKEDLASFSWGSADGYSRYFQDYQQFLRRPHFSAEAVDRSLAGRESVFVLKLDLAAFFDNINVDRLLSGLRAEYGRFVQRWSDRAPTDDAFWERARRILSFGWADEDQGLASLLKRDTLPSGLPQGLMASGFLANAYLLEFDRAVNAICTDRKVSSIANGTVTFHDYCRYVDDLRIVISVAAERDEYGEEEVANLVTTVLQELLDQSTDYPGAGHGPRLCFNADKTELELVTRVAGATSVAARMKQVQQTLSGPFDLEALEHLETSLSGLLSMAEASAHMAPVEPAGVPALATIAKPPVDVRDDTLTRFAGYRLCQSLKQRRRLTDLTEQVDGHTAGELLLQDFELTTRRLIGAWAENPSLVQVLRYAFDIYPSPALLQDVVSALTQKLSASAGAPDQAAVAWYVLAELFRSGAGETARWARADSDFPAGDIDAYREVLSAHAESLMQSGVAPWFVQQQAALLLAASGYSTNLLERTQELKRFRALHAYLDGKVLEGQAAEEDLVAPAIVGYQIRGDAARFAKWFNRFAVAKGRAAAKRALSLIFFGRPQLFDEILRLGLLSGTSEFLSREMAACVDSRPDGDILAVDTWIPLCTAIVHKTKVFSQENALLHLGLALTDLGPTAWKRDRALPNPFNLLVSCADWSALKDPRVPVLRVRHLPRRSDGGAMYATPAWCKPESAWMYAVGSILRAAAVGTNDFTLSARLGDFPEHGWYRGISSTVVKRRLGMLHSSQAVGGAALAVTPWFSGLFSVLLRWPGIAAVDAEPHEASSTRSIEDLRALLRRRCEFQAAIYGRSSDTALYRYPVEWPLREGRVLRVAVVQGLLPQAENFVNPGLAGMDSAPFRGRHRNHTATLLRLAAAKLNAHATAAGRPHKPEVDLVLFPEYSIHVDDQDLLRGFADDTGAMLHYGLLGAQDPVSGSPTNAARWLIPVRNKRRRSWIEVDQGKKYLTKEEVGLGVVSWCPYRVIIELQFPGEAGYRMSGAICYDATDLGLAADLKDQTHLFAVLAMNRDVKTFDSMVSALRYHMYQHVVLANSGEFGGSTAQAPYGEEFMRIISHVHGVRQISISVFDVALDDFGPRLLAVNGNPRSGKTPPAGLANRLHVAVP